MPAKILMVSINILVVYLTNVGAFFKHSKKWSCPSPCPHKSCGSVGGEEQLERDVVFCCVEICPIGIYSGDNDQDVRGTTLDWLDDGAARHRVQSFNAYTYSTLNPVATWDPAGHCLLSIVFQ